MLTDVQTFVGSVDTLFGGFRQRAEETYAMLQADDTAFVVVAAPERDALREASYFVERLEAESMPLAGLVLNRVQTTGVPELDAAAATAAAARLETGSRPSVTAALLRIHADRVATLERQRRLAERFTSVHRAVRGGDGAGDGRRTCVDLDGLRAVGEALADRA